MQALGGPALGMDMDVVDQEGNSLVESGEVGELVCRRPFPGMTRGFWRDPERYLDAYWRRLPGTWVHGDWASVDEDGYWFLHGRSDDTLNIAGKRIGPAELESAAVGHPGVVEAAAIGVPHEVKGEVAWLYCVVAPGPDFILEVQASTLAAFPPDGLVTDAASVDRSRLIHEEYSGVEGAEGGSLPASVSRSSGELVWTTMSSQSPQPRAGDRLPKRQLGCVRNDNRT